MCWRLRSSTNKQLVEKSRCTAMRGCFILLCVISRVSLEMQTVQHFYMARKERSNTPPIETGYVYNMINNQPSLMTFGNKEGHDKQFGYIENRLFDELTTKRAPEFSSEANISENTRKTSLTPTARESTEENKVKKYVPKRDVLFEKLQIKPSNNLPIYDQKDLLSDEQDVRTDLSNSNDGWPLFYHSPYEYEPMKFDNEMEKAQDKRFIVPEDRKVIPVHEHIKEDSTESPKYSGPDFTYTTDNPMLGNRPFFSYVLNDYFDKTDDEDPFSFKGLTWGKEFDQEMSFYDIDDYAKRIRRLEEDVPSHKKVYGAETELDRGSIQAYKQGDSYNNKEVVENTSENKNKHNSHSNNNYNGENNRGFRNFADYFANKFGSADHNNIFNHNIKNNVDKGEKKKGFRNVYHKDEYQEHTEFHDNNDNKADYENKGESKIGIRGSEGYLNSQAAAATGSDRLRIGKSEDNNLQNFFKNNKSDIQKRNHNLSQYRDVAKKAARSNNADYIDRFMT